MMGTPNATLDAIVHPLPAAVKIVCDERTACLSHS
ncbi:MAG: hypothetical protein RLZZ396_467 [Planctomycetota bacterium]|jgi:hypothetical protein